MGRSFTAEDGPEDLTGCITSGTNGSLQPWVPDGRPSRLAPVPMTAARERLKALRNELASIADEKRMKLRGVVI